MSVGFTTVYANHLQDCSGNLISNATISFTPVSSTTLRPIPFRCGGVEAATSWEPVTVLVTDGAFNIPLADTTLTTPVNIGYSVCVIDILTGDVLLSDGYQCIQPSGTTWDLDDYQPNLPAEITVQYGPQGLPGLPGGIAGGMFAGVPVGTMNGSNLTFTVAATPSIPMLFLNGVFQTLGLNYAFAYDTITYVTAPAATDSHFFIGVTPTTATSSSSTTSSSVALTDSSSGSVYTLAMSNGELTVYLGSTGTAVSGIALTDTVTGTVYTLRMTAGELDLVTGNPLSLTAVSGILLTDTVTGTAYTVSVKSGELVTVA